VKQFNSKLDESKNFKKNCEDEEEMEDIEEMEDEEDEDNMMEMNDYIKVEEEVEPVSQIIDPDWKDKSTKIRQMQIYNYKNKKFKTNRYIKLLHKLLMISVFIDDLTAAKLLCDSFMTNPFARLINGTSSFLLSISMGRASFVNFFLSQNYVYEGTKKKVDINKLLNKSEKKGYNNGLHLAVSKNRKDIIPILIKNKIQTDKVNFMNWEPFEMSKKKQYTIKHKRIYNDIENKEIISNSSLFNPDIMPQKLYGKFFNTRNHRFQI